MGIKYKKGKEIGKWLYESDEKETPSWIAKSLVTDNVSNKKCATQDQNQFGTFGTIGEAMLSKSRCSSKSYTVCEYASVMSEPGGPGGPLDPPIFD